VYQIPATASSSIDATNATGRQRFTYVREPGEWPA
jgi:hypothetical protein